MDCKKRLSGIALAFMGFAFLSGCGVQSIPRAKNKVESTLAEIQNQYKRRADLVPNLVETVKGYARQEKETLTQVTEARAKATSVQIDPSKASVKKLKKFQQAQGELSQALGRLLMVSERYPNLKSDRNFRELQAQLEGTENRIAVARQRHIEAIRQFNDLVTVFPSNITNDLFFNYEKMEQWAAPGGDKVEQTPEVKF